MKNCNQYFFSWKRYVFSQKKGLQKSAFLSKLFFYKNWSQNHIYTLEFLKILKVWKFSLQKQSPKGVLWKRCPATLLKKRLWHRCFSCEFCEIYKNTFFYRTTLVAASVSSMGNPNDNFRQSFQSTTELFKRANVACFTCCLPQNFSLKSQWTFYFPWLLT